MDSEFEEPTWKGLPAPDTCLLVMKDGVIVDKVHLKDRSSFTIGKLPECDIVLQHPSASRRHAILRFKHSGEAFIYDLNSANHTMLNRRLIPPKKFVLLHPNDQLRFGHSTRSYLFQSSLEPQDISIVKSKEEDKREQLTTFLEGQSINMTPVIKQVRGGGRTTFQVHINTTLMDESGNEIVGHGSGEEKEQAEKEAALDAWKKLIVAGLVQDEDTLRFKRLLKEYDEGDFDEDFYDKTRRVSKQQSTVETFDGLQVKQKELMEQIASLEAKREQLEKVATFMQPTEEEEDELDAFMTGINNQVHKDNLTALQRDLVHAQQQLDHINHLLQLAQPALFTKKLKTI